MSSGIIMKCYFISMFLLMAGCGRKEGNTTCDSGFEIKEGACYELDVTGSPDADGDGDLDADVGPPPDEGPPPDDPPDPDEDQDADGGGDTSCETDDDCDLTDCIAGSAGCACLEEVGACVPTCSTDADCPDTHEGEPMTCVGGWCEPPE